MTTRPNRPTAARPTIPSDRNTAPPSHRGLLYRKRIAGRLQRCDAHPVPRSSIVGRHRTAFRRCRKSESEIQISWRRRSKKSEFRIPNSEFISWHLGYTYLVKARCGMDEDLSYNIHVLGLKDASKAGANDSWARMERLTGRPRDEFEEKFPSPQIPVFQSLALDRTKKILDSLDSSGILVEIRPSRFAADQRRGRARGGETCLPGVQRPPVGIQYRMPTLRHRLYKIRARAASQNAEGPHPRTGHDQGHADPRGVAAASDTSSSKTKPLPKDAAKALSTIAGPGRAPVPAARIGRRARSS